MGLLEIITLGFALSMDTFSVAVAVGLQRCCSYKQTLRMAGSFAFFQCLMPIIGWFLGTQVHDIIATYDHWVAFILLSFVGGKMIYESREAQQAPSTDPTKGYTLLILSIATSIDALAVGISLAALKTDIFLPAVIIGIICFLVTALGLHLRKIFIKNQCNFAKYANVFGGILLIVIGIKILVEHGVFGDF